MRQISSEESGAFVERFTVEPTGAGALDGLTFAVKDLVDVAGYRTGWGNPTKRETNPVSTVSAPCVELLLAAGARCEGKTITDELAFSLMGENHHYGTPLNPAAPDRVPGGSSNGSASAVACGLVDFAIGTDTGGSVRVPASNCGIWGWRSTHGVVSVAGVMPLAPTFDTVGILARDADVMRRASSVLMGGGAKPPFDTAQGRQAAGEASVRVLIEPFEVADAEVREALWPVVDSLEAALDMPVRRTSLAVLFGEASAANLDLWADIYRRLTGAEATSSHGAWLADAKPAVGPMTESGFKLAGTVDRTKLGEVVGRRERYARALRRVLGPRDLLCIPSAPSIAPLKGTVSIDRQGDYYQRTLALGAIAGVGRLPQVSMPLATASGAPIGLSLIAAPGEDFFLLEVANAIGKRFAA
jgi:amidase